jgi:hypothetical protein
MTLRCDHCRQPLGRVVYYYWHMRFCSAACCQAYERRLQKGTRAKIRWLDGTRQRRPTSGPGPGLLVFRRLAG